MRDAEARTIEPLIRLAGVSRAFRRADGDVIALDSVALDVARGELLCLTGPSGSGKSTLLQILGLLDCPTEGSYWLEGEEVSALGERERARRRNREIGFVFQAFHLVPHLTIAENVELPLVYAEVAPRDRAERVSAALGRVGLSHRSRHLPDELSGGEQQRAAIARSLVAEPALVLADEPTGNLDEETAAGVLDLFREIHADGATLIVVTHNPRVASIAARTLEIRAGRVLPGERRPE